MYYPFVVTILGFFLVIGGFAWLIIRDSEDGFGKVIFPGIVLGICLVVGSFIYENSFSNCPCKVVLINTDGSSSAEFYAKAIFVGRDSQVGVWMGGLDYRVYYINQIRFQK